MVVWIDLPRAAMMVCLSFYVWVGLDSGVDPTTSGDFWAFNMTIKADGQRSEDY
jgi:hypothetical protein